MANNDSLDKVVIDDPLSSVAWISSNFEHYAIPSDLGQTIADPLDDHIHYRCQAHYLGPAYLKSHSLPTVHVDFYKVTRSEISELVYDMRKSGGGDRRWSSLGGGGGALLALSSPEGTDICHYLSEGEQSNTMGSTIPLVLPPKKRKKRRLTEQCVIFSITNHCGAHDALSSLSLGGIYYLFPQDSSMTMISDVAPLQMICTLQLPKQSITLGDSSTNYDIKTMHSSSSNLIYRTKLEQLAAICSSTEHLLSSDSSVDLSTNDTEHDSILIEISDASADLYYSLKEVVVGCQVSHKKRGALARLHDQHLESYKIESRLNTNRLLSHGTTVVQEYLTTGNGMILTAEQQLVNNADTYMNNQQSDSSLQLSPNNKRKHMAINGTHTNNKSEIDTIEKDHAPNPKKKTKRLSVNHGKQGSNTTTRTRQCGYCSATSTPMWRRGPEGAGTLCNACGVKWKHGKILTGDDTTTHQKHSKTNGKRKKSTTWTSNKKDKQTKTIKPSPHNESTLSTDLRLHEHVYYAQTLTSIPFNNASTIGISGLTASPSSSSNESIGHSPFTSFSSSPTSIDSQQHPLAFITEKFELNDDDLTLTSAAADVEAAAVLTLLSQS
ncbi:hypothetical protein BC941DRAFT_437006 [Chlamydoabsidia padenii]|nr:hypothetical protein BC941DRAFT_437006 [Chlamydoabsidia padenii]